MKNIFKYTFVAGLAVAALASCDLNLYPESAIVYDENSDFIQSESDLAALQNGIVASFRGHQKGDYWGLEEVMYGMFNACSDYGNNYGAPHRLEDNIADDYDIRDFWSGHYGSIKNDNVLISEVNKIKDADLKKKGNVAKGYAFLFRADSYLQLVRHYGKAYGSTSTSDLGVPLVLKFNLEETPARNTVKECYDQVKADLDSAAVLLAGQAGAVASQLPTIDCVNAVYARYYLDIKDYANAAAYAEKVINSAAGYQLLSTAKEFENYYTYDKGTEAIMQTYASIQETGNGYSMFTSLSNYTAQGYGYVYVPYFIPTKAAVEQYEEGDLRFGAWFTNDKRYTRQNGSFYKGQFYVFNKFEGNPDLTTSGIPAGTNATRPYTVPEMYLIAAEAYVQAGNANSAAKYLNALQAARNTTETEATLANVQREWNRETIGDGLRLSNLKRWGLGFDVRTPQDGALANHIIVEGVNFDQLSMSATDFHHVWPIPTYEMQVNDNLVQNEGYVSE